jgi:glycerol uptake facilitator-like aquaporin
MGIESGLMGHATRAFVRIVATVVVAYAIATAIRFGLVERDDLGPICQSAASPWWCDLRMLVIRGFLDDVYGRASLVLAALAIWRRSAVAATLAVAIGTFGMVLYSFTWSGIGLLGGALVLARLQGQWQQHAQSEQHAG